jgi:hypothetical protein
LKGDGLKMSAAGGKQTGEILHYTEVCQILTLCCVPLRDAQGLQCCKVYSLLCDASAGIGTAVPGKCLKASLLHKDGPFATLAQVLLNTCNTREPATHLVRVTVPLVAF